jgi:hypothetical protein
MRHKRASRAVSGIMWVIEAQSHDPRSLTITYISSMSGCCLWRLSGHARKFFGGAYAARWWSRSWSWWSMRWSRLCRSRRVNLQPKGAAMGL